MDRLKYKIDNYLTLVAIENFKAVSKHIKIKGLAFVPIR